MLPFSRHKNDDEREFNVVRLLRRKTNELGLHLCFSFVTFQIGCDTTKVLHSSAKFTTKLGILLVEDVRLKPRDSRSSFLKDFKELGGTLLRGKEERTEYRTTGAGEEDAITGTTEE